MSTFPYDETIYEFHFDAGHGWLKLPENDVQELGIASRITHYSYWSHGYYYLEEDCDFATFAGAYFDQYGHEVLIDEIDDGRDSPIRHMRRVASYQTI